jgi:hypothetical protein
MFFLNLTLPEFLALLGTLSVTVVALYLLDRRRRKLRVATLRFFRLNEKPPEMKHRRRVQQPWSLILQLVSLLLLLLAIAQLRLGSPDRSSRDHVLLLDASAWMAARTANPAQAGNVTRLIDLARSRARAYVRALPHNDRVMVVRAGELPMPATLFETDRQKIVQAIDQTQPGASALDIDKALEFAEQAQALRARRAGEIVFAGAGRVPGDGPAAMRVPPNLRIIPVTGAVENIGLRKVALRRSLSEPDTWDIFVAVKNYGVKPHPVPLAVLYGGSPVGSRRLNLNPGAEETATFQFKTRAGGWLEARLLVRDAFPEDDRAVLELPARQSLLVTVYSDQPDLLRPVFTAIPDVKATFLAPSRFNASATSGIVILDRFAPATPPKTDAIWIEPPVKSSPISVRNVGTKLKLARWRSDHVLGTGLRAKDIELDSAEVFRLEKDDIAIAETDIGPVMAGRDGKTKTVVLGFHPVNSALKYELATPLLFANILHWMATDIFRLTELTAGTVGLVNVDLESQPDPSTIRVVSDDGRPVPFTIDGRYLRFFTESPGIVRVVTGARELVYSLSLPQAGDTIWNPATAHHGIPSGFPSERSARDLWQWLALLGGAGLFADWMLFGRRRRAIPYRMPAALRATKWRKAS